jgi:hypothetical protein
MTAIALQHFALEFSESSKKSITWKNRALLISLQQQRSRKATHTERSRKQESKRNEKPERGRETMGPRRVGKWTLVWNPRLALNGRSRPLVIACVVGSADSATQDPKLLTFGSGFMPEWFGANQVPIQVLSKYDLLRLGSLGIWIATVKKEFYTRVFLINFLKIKKSLFYIQNLGILDSRVWKRLGCQINFFFKISNVHLV